MINGHGTFHAIRCRRYEKTWCHADLSVQTGAGERIGDLPLAAKVARKSTAKITCPTSRWRIENRLQRQSAFPPAPDASAATVAARAPAQVAVRTFIVR